MSNMPAEAALQSTLTRFLPSAGILDALNMQKAHIVGHDWGSALGWVFAGFYPERTIQLVAISVGHPAGYLKGEHRGEQKQKSWCAVECICIIAHLLCQRGQQCESVSHRIFAELQLAELPQHSSSSPAIRCSLFTTC